MSDTPDTPGSKPNQYLKLHLDPVPPTSPAAAPAPKNSDPSSAPPAPRAMRPAPALSSDIVFSATPSLGVPSEFLEPLLRYCTSVQASDLHLTPGLPPLVRVHGDLIAIPERPPLRAEETESLSESIMNSGQRRALAEAGAADGACSSEQGARFRFNVFRRQGRRVIILRRLEDRFRSLAELGLSDELYRLAKLQDGLVVFSGATGCGKSTTLATLLDKINRERRCHIITIEDPIEYIHDSRLSEVNQRELYSDVPDFNSALIAALREDPDVLLVGECRDLKTIRMAITAAETGHLVFTTIHAPDCAGTIERLVSVFPSDEQEGVRRQLALVLRAVVNQQLLPSRRDGRKSRVAAAEVLVNTTAVSNLIVLGKTSLLYTCMETGQNVGMHTMDQDLARLWAANLIDESTATATCRNVTVLKERAQFLRNSKRNEIWK